MHLDMSMQKYDFGKEEHRNLSIVWQLYERHAT